MAPHSSFDLPPIILASSSPRRSELLRNVGIIFHVEHSQVPENPRPAETPLDFARRLAQEKAQAVAARQPGEIILGADTIVLVGEEMLNKPENEADALRMLAAISGRQHEVTTAVCLLVPGKPPDVRHEITRVFVSEITKEEMQAYVRTREPMDKAGAYAIQGLASRWIYRIEGDYANVVGLPVALVVRMLRERA